MPGNTRWGDQAIPPSSIERRKSRRTSPKACVSTVIGTTTSASRSSASPPLTAVAVAVAPADSYARSKLFREVAVRLLGDSSRYMLA
jgi:hypothetical protein